MTQKPQQPQSSPAPRGIANLTNVGLLNDMIERIARRSPHLPGMGVMHGPSGYGKSLAAAHAQHPNGLNAWLVQCKSIWTRKSFLESLLKELGIAPAATLAKMLDQATEQIATAKRPLIIDEADYPSDKGYIELIRDLYESTKATIILIGEEGLPQKLRRWERIDGRIMGWQAAQPVSGVDVRELTRIYAREVKISDDLLDHLVQIAKGSVRRVCVNLELIQDTAREEGLATVDLKSWGKRDLYTGKAPERRL